MNTSSTTESVSETSVWHCELCGFTYNEVHGLAAEDFAPGTLWADVPDSWGCPDCGQPKGDFMPLEFA
jgi:rubredoxin